MKITNYVPKDWKDLQNKVCQFLNESGYPSESPKEITTVRGTVEVDVFSTSETELIKQFICECKFWNTPVPKEKIHAFRTVVHDSGSTVGIFISKNGYQSGAIEAAYCSNVLLKDWDGFINLIEHQWLTHQLPKIKKSAHPLSVYTDFLDVPFEKLSDEEIKLYKNSNEKYTPIFSFCRFLTPTCTPQQALRLNGTIFTAYDELFEYLSELIPSAIKEYETLFKDSPVDPRKLEDWRHMLIDF